MSKDQLASLQLAIMRVLWDRGEASVSDVRGELAGSGRDLAYTTVATMLVSSADGSAFRRIEGDYLHSAFYVFDDEDDVACWSGVMLVSSCMVRT